MARQLPSGRRVAPSILSADFSRLGAQIEDVMAAGARVIHVDVMDGHFVPPITMGPLVVDAIRDLVHDRDGFVDVHLMIERPERHVAEFARAGADQITVHAEATPHLDYAVKAVRDAGCLAGVALNPGTAPEVVFGLRDLADTVLCMTVNPGWGGQQFIPQSPAKVQGLSQLTAAAIEVDGGVDERTAGICADAGATLLVAGSAVFGSDDPAAAYGRIAQAAGAE